MSETAALATAVTSVAGAIDAVAEAPKTVERVFRLSKKLCYGTGYLAAYVLVFPTALVLAAIPKRNALVQGFIDGTSSATARAEKMVA